MKQGPATTQIFALTTPPLTETDNELLNNFLALKQ